MVGSGVSTGPSSSGPTSSAPATTQSTSKPSTRPTTNPGAPLVLNFRDTPVDAVLDYLSEAAGFVIVREVPMEARITLMSKQPVGADEAVMLLRTVLKSSGFTAVQEGRVLRIIARDKAKKGNVPVRYGADPAAVEASDEMFTQIIPIRNMDAGKLQKELAPLIGTDADVTTNEASNAILMTDLSTNIRRVLLVIAALDQKEVATTDLRLVQLKNANATATSKLLMSIFKPGASDQLTPQQLQMMQQQGGGGQPPHASREGRIPGGGLDQALRGGHVNIVADERTNTIVVTAPTDTLKVIDGIITELDGNPVPASELRAFPLTYADAEATSKLVTSLFKPDDNSRNFMSYYWGGGGGQQEQTPKIKINVTFDERTNSVIVTAPVDVLKSVEALIKQLDSNPVSQGELRTYPLKYADAYSVSRLIKSIFSPDTKGGGDNPLRYLFYGISPQSSSAHGPKVTTDSDDRTNTLIVTAPSEAMKAIETLVKQLDSNPTADETLFIYHLQNAQSANLEVVLNELFGNLNGQNGQQNGNGRNGQNGDNGNGNGQQGQDQNRRSQQQQSQQSLGGGTGSGARRGGGQGSAAAQRNGRQLSPGSAKAVTEMSGMVSVVADVDTNSLIVTTATKYEKKVKEIIEELDRPVSQVLIKVLIAEVTHDNSDDMGVDFSILNRRANGNGQAGIVNLGNAAAGTANGGLVVSLVETNVTATLHALATAGKLDVLSRPYILASDNHEATITVGQEVPFITNSRTTDLGQTLNTIQYQDIGIILNVTPHINPEGLVILDVAPEISQLTGTTVPISETVSAPVFAKRSAESRVGIRDGQTIVIGGLMEDRKTQTISKVPLLGDLPWIGPAFQRNQDSKTKTELLIFLTPHVAIQPDALRPMSQDEMKATTLTQNAVEPGTFHEHLRGMERGGRRPGDHLMAPGPNSVWPPTTSASPGTTQPASNPTIRVIGD